MVETALLVETAIMVDMAILVEMAILIKMAIMVDMAIYGHGWPCMALYGHSWPYMAMHFFRCVKLRENPENQSFTFFGSLPPYLGVSDSFAYSKQRGLKRSIDWYKEFLISCLAARYSAVFVIKTMEIHGNRWKSMEIQVELRDRHYKI